MRCYSATFAICSPSLQARWIVYPLILLVDKAPIHTEAKMLQEFHDWGCQELTEVIAFHLHRPSASVRSTIPCSTCGDNGCWRSDR